MARRGLSSHSVGPQPEQTELIEYSKEREKGAQEMGLREILVSTVQWVIPGWPSTQERNQHYPPLAGTLKRDIHKAFVGVTRLPRRQDQSQSSIQLYIRTLPSGSPNYTTPVGLCSGEAPASVLQIKCRMSPSQSQLCLPVTRGPGKV